MQSGELVIQICGGCFMADLKGIAEAIIKGDRDATAAKVDEAIKEKVSAEQILNEGLMAGMSVIGDRFKKNEVYVPEVLIAARAMKAGMDLLQPLLADAGVEPVGKVVLGTVKGDLHDIGKNLVRMMLQGGGFEVVDCGIDVSAEKFLESAKESGAKIVAMSALLTTTMPQMADVVKSVKESGIKDVKTMIGGAPVTQAYADEIGADGYAPDAASAVDTAKELTGS
jgi:5-methyltetrahydrofolate--homocysteine methyltransferase